MFLNEIMEEENIHLEKYIWLVAAVTFTPALLAVIEAKLGAFNLPVRIIWPGLNLVCHLN